MAHTETTLVKLLMIAPDSQLDESMKPLVAKWDDPPKALQILEVLDKCAHAALASDFTMEVIDTLWERACDREGITKDECIKKATWRKK